jgi:hypothetical protein
MGVPALAIALALMGGCGSAQRSIAPSRSASSSPQLPPTQYGRNVVRIPGRSPSDVAGAAVLALYPSRQTPPAGWILTRDDNWRVSAIAAQFAANPVDAGLMPIKSDYLPPATNDLLGRFKPPGFPKGNGLQAFVLGGAASEVFGQIEHAALKTSQLNATTPAELAAKLVPYRAGFAGAISANIVAVSDAAADAAYALPAQAWTAYSGDTLVFAGHDRLSAATIAILVQRQKVTLQRPTVYLVGPPDMISPTVAAQLGQYATVKRIGGATPAAAAVALARYRDASTGFGWGLVRGPASVSFVNPRYWGDTAGADAFAARGPQAPLLLTGSDGGLPPVVVGYLRSLRGAKSNQAFAFGDQSAIPTTTLIQLDYALDAIPPKA